MNRIASVGLFLVAATASLFAQNPSLTLGTTSGNPGTTVTTSVTLASLGQTVQGLEFQLNYDTTNLAPQPQTTASITTASPNITVTSNTGIVAGEVVSGSGIPHGTTVSSITGNNVVLSANATATNASAALTFVSLTVALSSAVVTTGSNAGSSFGLSTSLVANGLTIIISNTGASPDNPIPLPDGDILDITIRIPPTAAPATYPLTFASSNVSPSIAPTWTDPAGDNTSSNDTPTTTNGQVTVNALAQSITFGANPGPLTVGGATGTVTATGGASGNPVTFSSTTTGVCTTGGTNGATVTAVAVGSCIIAANQAAGGAYAAAPQVTQTITISKGTPTITFNNPGGQAFNNSPLTLSATTTAVGGSPIVFTASPGSVCTAGGTNGTTLTFVSTGNCTVSANEASSANYNQAAQVQQTFTIAGATQAITNFGNPGAQQFVPSPLSTVTVSATGGGSGNPVTFTSATSAVCTTGGTNGSTVTLVGGGTCTINANEAGTTPTYSAAPQLQQSFTVNPAAQTISFTQAAVTYGVGTITLNATASSGLAVTFAATGSAGVCSTGGTNGATVTISGAGTCTINANQAGNASYTVAQQVQVAFAVNMANQTITFGANPGTQTYSNGLTVTVSATAPGGTVTFTSGTTPVCTTGGTNGATVTIVTGGTCTIDANIGASANYNAAPQATQSFTINAANQQITFPNPGSQGYGGAPTTLSATASSGLAVSFASTTTSVCTTTGANGATLTLLQSGTCIINANQAGNTSYNPAAQVQDTFTVNGEAQTITFGTNPGAQTYSNGLTVTVSATASSTLAVTFTSATTSVCTTSGTTGTVSIVGAGTCTINANQAGNSTFGVAPQVQQSFTVNQATQAITFGANPGTQTFAVPNPTVTVSATAGSGLAVTFTSATSSVCTTSGTNGATVTIIGAGTCTINANQAGNANFSAAPQMQQSFTVNQASQTITFNPAANAGYGTTPTLTATASSNLAVSFTSTTPLVCTTGGTNGATLTLVSLGACTIDANQAGNGNYAAAAQVQGTITVVKGSQTISFSPPGSINLGSAPITLTATATSGQTVMFASTTPSVCTATGANGATLSVLTVGTCTVTANQAGNGLYNAATQVSANIAVITLTITAPASLPNAQVNGAYNTTFTATGGSGIYTWSATGLPPGMTMNPAGVLLGPPTSNANSPYTVVITVSDTNHNSISKAYALIVLPAAPTPPTLTLNGPFTLPSGAVGQVYPATAITATGGTQPYKWSANLPAGLSIASATGVISGTPLTGTNGIFNVMVTVTDANSNTASAGYNLTINSTLMITGPSALPTGAVGEVYSAGTVTAAGGLAPYSWSATGLPSGISIGAGTGAISGTPLSAAGSPYAVQVAVIDTNGAKATMNYTLTINPALTITGPATLPAATVYVAYSSTMVTANGGIAPYMWSESGLPLGLNINAATGVISGTTAASVGSPFSVQVTVTDSKNYSSSMNYTVTVNQAPLTLPTIGGVSNAAGGQLQVGPNTWVSIYGANFTSPNFTDTWSSTIVKGNLPTVLDGVSVMIGGQPAYISYLSATQINILTPNISFGPLQLTVTAVAGTSAPVTVTSQAESPAIFPWPNNQPVATHTDFSDAAAAGTFTGLTTVPAKPGETIILWGTGFGPTNPATPYGIAIPTGTLYMAANPVTVMINGLAATVTSVALAPGLAGLYQVAVVVPSTLANGTYPVTLSVGTYTSPALTLTVHN